MLLAELACCACVNIAAVDERLRTEQTEISLFFMFTPYLGLVNRYIDKVLSLYL